MRYLPTTATSTSKSALATAKASYKWHKPRRTRAISASKSTAPAAAAGIDNLRVIRHDAVAILRDHVADGTLARVQIYFPDPWPKARHHKRRIVQKPFTDLIWRKLRAGGEIHCATDWAEYAEWMRDVFASDDKWQNLGGADGYAPRPDWRPQTKFERRGERLGHGVWDLRYRKN